jgi:hypothetical protein
MVIENAHILYYKYFFLYILQCEQQELCWQIILQPSFLLGFNAFLCAVIKLELNHYPTNFRYIKITQAMVVIGKYIEVINSHDGIPLEEYQEIIRKVFVYYQSGFSFLYFDQSFFYWIAKITFLLMIFTRNGLENIRRLTVEDVQTCISLSKKEDKSSRIPQYQIILDVCPIEIIVHFLQLRKKMWKTSNFIFAGSVSGIPLTSESLSKIISVQLRRIGLSWDDLELVRCSSNLLLNSPLSRKSFDKTSNILF